MWVVTFVSASAGYGGNSCRGHNITPGPPMASLPPLRLSEMPTQLLYAPSARSREAGSQMASGLLVGLDAKLTPMHGLPSDA
jgi:hypothetical protein